MRKNVLILAACAAIFLVAVSYIYRQPAVDTPPAPDTVEIGGRVVRIDVATTLAERQQGLSGRAGLDSDQGMLFVFPQADLHGFWMKDMRFPIDIVWLSFDGVVVYMAQNISPDTYPQVFKPDRPAQYVLELPAGYAKAYNVKVGDLVRH